MNLDTIASFTWLWDDEFFLEAPDGNYIWSDPDYRGDNTIRPYFGSYWDYLQEKKIGFGRDKGKHKIREYCGTEVMFT